MSGAGESAAAKATSVPRATHKVCWGVVPRSAGHLVHDTKDTKSTFWHHPADAGTRPLRSRKGHTSSWFVRPTQTEPTPTPPILACEAISPPSILSLKNAEAHLFTQFC